MKAKPGISPPDLEGLKFYQYVNLNRQLRDFDVVIIGGSYAGLSAALTLVRSLKKVLIIDAGNTADTRNGQVIQNVIGESKTSGFQMLARAKETVLGYKNVRMIKDKAELITGENNKFVIETRRKEHYTAKKILLATGIKYVMPDLPGFSACWGITVFNCPYCNGYGIKDQDAGLLCMDGNAYDTAIELANWCNHLSLFTNGKTVLSQSQREYLSQKNIKVIDQPILKLSHHNGHLNGIIFANESVHPVNVLFFKPKTLLAGEGLRQQLNCSLTEQGFIQKDEYQRTSTSGVYTAGDAGNPLHLISTAMAEGTVAGIFINREIIEESN